MLKLNKPFDVQKIERARAAEFINAHHYSKTTPTGYNIFFGCFVDGDLFAVVNYGTLATRTGKGRGIEARATGRSDATETNTLELRRMARVGSKEDKGPLRLSHVLKECHRLLALEKYRYILSYSDRKFNSFDVVDDVNGPHSGWIYRAARFKWLGATKEEMHCEDVDGNPVHRSRAYRRMLSHNEALCKEWEFTVERANGGNQDRVWPTDKSLWAKDASLPPDKLWTLDQVRVNMGLRTVKCPPKDKWLLVLPRA